MPLYRRLWTCGAVVAVFLLAACGSFPLDSSWGDISLIGETPTIMFAFNDRIVQIDPTDGSAVELVDSEGRVRVDDEGNPRPWLVQLTDSPTHFYTRPLMLDDDTLVAAAYEDRLFEVDLPTARIEDADGTPLPGKIVGNPLLANDLLYMPLSEGGIVALNPDDYTEVWRFTPDNAKGVWSEPLLIEDTLYISSMNHMLYALAPETGETRWSLDIQGAVASTPTYANDALYVGSFGRKVFKVSLTGSILAEFTTNDWVWGAPAVVGDMVYVTDLGGYVYALRDSGDSFDEVWSRKVAERAIRMTPLVTADTMVVGSRDHNIYWVSLETGEELIKREMRGEILSNILLIEEGETINETMIVVSTLANEERLVAFSLDRGERRWVYGV